MSRSRTEAYLRMYGEEEDSPVPGDAAADRKQRFIRGLEKGRKAAQQSSGSGEEEATVVEEAPVEAEETPTEAA